MNTLYQIKTESGESGILNSTVVIDPQHVIFKGHFPERPVMPGVCMMQIVHDALTQGLQKEVKLKSIASVKFSNMWLPDQYLEAHIKLSFEKTEDEIKIKSGLLYNGDTIFFKLKAGYYVVP